MMLLEDLFLEYGDKVLYHVELKGSKAQEHAALVNDVIGAHGMQANCVVTSFSYDALLRMRAANPSIRLGWLLARSGEPPEEVAAKARECELRQLCPFAGTLTPEAVAGLRAAAPEVRAWGISGSWRELLSRIDNVLRAGCDGTTIDWPDWLRPLPGP